MGTPFPGLPPRAGRVARALRARVHELGAARVGARGAALRHAPPAEPRLRGHAGPEPAGDVHARAAGHGERSCLQLLFKLGGRENLSILAVNVWAVNCPLTL